MRHSFAILPIYSVAMQNRLRLLMGASALLYFGPLLAGLTGMGWNALPVFVGLLALWLVIMRPRQWPRDLAQWDRQTVVAAIAQIAVNTLIVVILFGIGAGIGGVAGFVPDIPPVVPIGLSFLATPLSRLIHNPATGAEVDHALDEALTWIEGGEIHPLSGGEDAILRTLLDLPDDADPALTAEALGVALKGREGQVRLARLRETLAGTDEPKAALRRGLILWATDPQHSAATGNQTGLAAAFQSAAPDPDLLCLFAERGVHLLEGAPRRAADFPPTSELERAIDAGVPPAVRGAVMGLTRRLRALSPSGA